MQFMMPSMMMPGMNSMGQCNPMGDMMMMMQLLQMMQLMQMTMGQQQGQCGCRCGNQMQMPMGPQMGQMMNMPQYYPQQQQMPWNNSGGWQQSGPMSQCRPADMSAISGGSQFGNQLASLAANNCNGPGGQCYQYAKRPLARMGVNLHGGSAYQAAGQLANDPRFQEVQVSREQLRSLPPGAVVVWNRGGDHEHGHISIALGNGREASDKNRPQITNYGTQFRVFLPRDGGNQGGPRTQYA